MVNSPPLLTYCHGVMLWNVTHTFESYSRKPVYRVKELLGIGSEKPKGMPVLRNTAKWLFGVTHGFKSYFWKPFRESVYQVKELGIGSEKSTMIPVYVRRRSGFRV